MYQKPSVVPTPEDVPLIIPDVTNPRYSYGGTKILYELMGQHYRREEFDRVILFRPHNVYGKNMGTDHVIPELVKKIRNSDKEITLLGDGKQTRAFCYVDDFCDGVHTLLEKGEDGEIYHIGNDEEVTIEELCRRILKQMNLDLEIKYSEAPQGETNRIPRSRRKGLFGGDPIPLFSKVESRNRKRRRRTTTTKELPKS